MLSDRCMHLKIIKAPSVYTKRILLILALFLYSDITDIFWPVFAIIREVIHDGLYLVPHISHGDITHAGSYQKYFFISLKLVMHWIIFCFKVKRPGDKNVRCTILLLLDYQPLQFKLDPRLARLLGVHTQTRPAIISALWQYIKTHRLQVCMSVFSMKYSSSASIMVGCRLDNQGTRTQCLSWAEIFVFCIASRVPVESSKPTYCSWGVKVTTPI